MSVSQWSQMWAADPEASLRTSFGPGRDSARNDGRSMDRSGV